MFTTAAQLAKADDTDQMNQTRWPVFRPLLRGGLAIVLATALAGCGFCSAGASPAGEPPVRRVHAWWSTYHSVDGPLFVAEGPSAYDVEQGEVGTCWLLAAMAAVAHQQPAIIERMLEPQADGTYLVYIHDTVDLPDSTGVAAATPVRVTTMIPNSLCGGPLYARTRRGTWVSLVEKAYAQHFAPTQGYEGIGSNHPHVALSRLTGWAVEDYDIDGNLSGPTEEEEWRWLLAAYRDAAPMVAGSRILQIRPEIVAMHAYAVTGVYTDPAGRRIVRLFDPEGLNDSPNHELELPVDEFNDYFFYVSIARAPSRRDSTRARRPRPLRLP